MAHPMNEHRAHIVERRRAREMHGTSHPHQDTVRTEHITGKSHKPHRAKGGAVNILTGKKPKMRLDRKRGGKIDGTNAADNYLSGKGKKHGGMQDYDEGANPVTDKIDAADKRNYGNKEFRARGGRTKHKKSGTHVNVIVAPQHHPAPMGGPPPGGLPMPPPRPPMAGPPPGGPPGMPPGMPPPGVGGPPGMPPGGMPPRPGIPPMGAGPGMLPGMRRDGGRAYKHGGHVHGDEAEDRALVKKMLAQHDKKQHRAAGGGVTPTQKGTKVFNAGIKAGTPVQHSGNKMDGQNMGRAKPVTYKTGGKVYSGNMEGGYKPKEQMAPKLPGGAGGGEARLAKRRMYHNGVAP